MRCLVLIHGHSISLPLRSLLLLHYSVLTKAARYRQPFDQPAAPELGA